MLSEQRCLLLFENNEPRAHFCTSKFLIAAVTTRASQVRINRTKANELY